MKGIYICVVLIAISLFANAEVTIDARGYDWQKYTVQEKEQLIGMVYHQLGIDNVQYPLQETLGALNTYYMIALKKAKQEPEKYDADFFLKEKCSKLIEDIIKKAKEGTGQDIGQKLSPNGKQIVFIREIRISPITSFTGWVPGDYDEVWTMDAYGRNKRCIITNNYSPNQDMDNYLGSFDNLHWSPDGQYIYFLCQNSASNAILYRANRDGANIKRLSHGHGISGVVGGSPEDEYYGYILVDMKKYSENQPNRWVSVLLTSDGKEITEIKDVEAFWKEHKKI